MPARVLLRLPRLWLLQRSTSFPGRALLLFAALACIVRLAWLIGNEAGAARDPSLLWAGGLRDEQLLDPDRGLRAWRVDPALVHAVGGLAFELPVPGAAGAAADERGPRAEELPLLSRYRSTLQLFLDGQPLGPPHARHSEIARLGGGRFSHWRDEHGAAFLRFSIPDSMGPVGVESASRLQALAFAVAPQAGLHDVGSPGARSGSAEESADRLELAALDDYRASRPWVYVTLEAVLANETVKWATAHGNANRSSASSQTKVLLSLPEPRAKAALDRLCRTHFVTVVAPREHYMRDPFATAQQWLDGHHFCYHNLVIVRSAKHLAAVMYPGGLLVMGSAPMDDTDGDLADRQVVVTQVLSASDWEYVGVLCVYALMTGAYDEVPDQAGARALNPEVRILLFADPLPPGLQAGQEHRGWEVHALPKTMAVNPPAETERERSRAAKFLPWLLPELRGCELTMHVDANTQIVGGLGPLFARMAPAYDIGLYRIGRSWEEEMDWIVRSRGYPKPVVAAQVTKYERDGFRGLPSPEGCSGVPWRPLCNATYFGKVLLRYMRMRRPQVERFGKVWWEEFKSGVQRDQLSLPYAAWKAAASLLDFGMASRGGTPTELEATKLPAFTKYFLRVDHKRPPSQRPYRACSLVSTSGILLQGRWGGEIDAADAVFRISLAPVEGFEEHVGRKTTVRILRPSMFQKGRGIPLDRVHVLVNDTPAAQVAWMIEAWEREEVGPAIGNFQSQHPDTVFLEWAVPEGAWACVSREGKRRQPSSGFSAAYKLLESMCDSLTLFGFHTPPQVQDSTPYHYYDLKLRAGAEDDLNLSTGAMFRKKALVGGHAFQLEHEVLLASGTPSLAPDTNELVIRIADFASLRRQCESGAA